MSDLLRGIQEQLRREGHTIDRLEIDHLHPQVQSPTHTVAVGISYRHFYAKLFRWRSGSMMHGVLLRPKVDGHAANAREDVDDMIARLVVAIKQTCARAA